MQKRKYRIIRSLGNRHVAVDVSNAKQILAFAQAHQKKWNQILGIILENLRVPKLFDKEDINEFAKDVWAMKFRAENDRLYCKEIRTSEGFYIIVTSELLEKKKNQKVQQREKSIIEKVAKYEYEPDTEGT